MTGVAFFYRCEPGHHLQVPCVYDHAQIIWPAGDDAAMPRCARHYAILVPLVLDSIKQVSKWLREERARRAGAECPDKKKGRR